MPIVTVNIAQGRTIDQKRALAEAVTQAIVSTLNVKPEWVTVLVNEHERENWATGGVLHSDKLGAGCGRQGTDSSSP